MALSGLIDTDRIKPLIGSSRRPMEISVLRILLISSCWGRTKVGSVYDNIPSKDSRNTIFGNYLYFFQSMVEIPGRVMFYHTSTK